MRFCVVLLMLGVVFTGCGGSSNSASEESEVIQLGEPATYEWPAHLSCPASLSALCSDSDLVLVGTVNLGTEAVVNAATFGTNAHIVCRWPVEGAESCEQIGSTGATVIGEAAIYGTPN